MINFCHYVNFSAVHCSVHCFVLFCGFIYFVAVCMYNDDLS